MVLHVDFRNLAEEAKRHGIKPWAYLWSSPTKRIVTIGDPHAGTLIQAETSVPYEQVQASLVDQGLLVAHGRWLPDPLAGEIQIQEQYWVAGVAYRSSQDKPGLWMHAYRGQPSVGDVIRAFYDDMAAETDLSEVSLDAFIAEVDPNVVVLGPDELAAFADNGASAPKG